MILPAPAEWTSMEVCRDLIISQLHVHPPPLKVGDDLWLFCETELNDHETPIAVYPVTISLVAEGVRQSIIEFSLYSLAQSDPLQLSRGFFPWNRGVDTENPTRLLVPFEEKGIVLRGATLLERDWDEFPW